ncbi:MAG: sugar ABC transporter substrate-binding protein [Kiloniellales bacterium]|nr:sugar ABC transporter substrate-binding protein [Kiloniellales bacterium]
MTGTRALLSLAAAAAIIFSAGSSAWAQSAAERAVEAAKQYSGGEISIVWEAGLQSLDPLNFSGPRWEELTGIKVKVIEVPTAEMFTKILQEHRAGTGAYDALNVIPSWMPDLVKAGALEELDPYVDKYGFREELQKIAPTYRDNQMTVDGKIYGFPDDGDLFVLYYRKDLFEDAENQAAFKAKYGYDLAAPATWQQYADIGQFITDKYAPEIYGAGQFRGPAYGIWLFEERYRVEGGRFFDPETMKAQINNEIGVKVYEGMRNDNKFMPPGVESWGFGEALSSFLAGDIAMTISWPPFGRWAAGYGVEEEALSWVPKSKIADKVGYALPPGGTPQLAAGFSLSVSSKSKNKEAAYLFIQWLNSEEVSLQRVQLPYALRDPFRESHFTNKEYLSRWQDAPDYLKTLREGADTGLLDLSILQIDKYEEALRQSITRLWAGEDAKAILDDTAAQWDSLTEKIGVEKQKAAYADWASKPNAYPK